MSRKLAVLSSNGNDTENLDLRAREFSVHAGGNLSFFKPETDSWPKLRLKSEHDYDGAPYALTEATSVLTKVASVNKSNFC